MNEYKIDAPSQKGCFVFIVHAKEKANGAGEEAGAIISLVLSSPA